MEVPQKITFEGDRELISVGDVDKAKDCWHEQGDNENLMQGTCGLASLAASLRMLGLQVTENEVVDYAVKNQLCDQEGGTTVIDQVKILNHFGVPAHYDLITSNAQVADAIAHGQTVLVAVNAGSLWREELAGQITPEKIAEHTGNGRPNHMIEVVGFDVDPKTHEVVHFFVNDTGVHNGAAHMISAETFARATANAPMVVSELRPATPSV